jgi:hypothetical protein
LVLCSGFQSGFWVDFGGGLARGGLRGGLWWVAGWVWVVGTWQWWFLFGGFQWFWVCVFSLFCFTLLQTHNVEYFSEHFPRMQTNIEKTIIFPEIIYIYKHFTVKNVLRRNKRSLRVKSFGSCKITLCNC